MTTRMLDPMKQKMRNTRLGHAHCWYPYRTPHIQLVPAHRLATELPNIMLSLPRSRNFLRCLPLCSTVREVRTFHLGCLLQHSSAVSPKQSRQAPVNVHSTRLQGLNRPGTQLLRFFQTESDFHTAADETLEGIQDAIDEALEAKGVPDFEVTFASGVLTLVFPPHGTWVINKQTPNRQLWWSSPISGPRRYEYEDDEWVFTRDDSHSMTLEKALKEELEQIYDVHVDL